MVMLKDLFSLNLASLNGSTMTKLTTSKRASPVNISPLNTSLPILNSGVKLSPVESISGKIN